MNRMIQLLPIAIAVLGACGSPKPIKYYALQIPTAPAPATHTYPIDLWVARPAGPDLLASAPIVYRTGVNQVGTYTYHRWTDCPLDMVQEKLVRLLRKSGDYESVGSGHAGSGDLTIRGRLYDFAEVDGDAITGLVTMEFELYNRRTAKVLWTHFYSQTEAVEAKEVPSVVRALDRNLDRGLNEVVTGLSKYFAAHPPSSTESTAQ
jgi:ABC-type uncharacterized transport system auxiliary subunit